MSTPPAIAGNATDEEIAAVLAALCAASAAAGTPLPPLRRHHPARPVHHGPRGWAAGRRLRSG